jgi:quinoprotein glucose dehydrogenase
LTSDSADRRIHPSPPRIVATLLRSPFPAAALLVAIALGLLVGAAPRGEGGAIAEWPSYGGDPGGSRYTPLDDITAGNLSDLEIAWTYRTGDVSDGKGELKVTSAFELTPLLVDGSLFACTPFNRVIALDPETGAERWSFDPGLDLSGRYANQFVCRGVATWLDPDRGAGDPCKRRIFTATNDARLFALDAVTGARCADFGNAGEVDLNPGVGEQLWKGEYQVTSPPAVAGNLVVVGSAVADNARVDAPSGVVRAFDARSGALRWAWDLSPPGGGVGSGRSEETGYMLGTPNVWAQISVDEARDLVFVPTGNPAPDYWGGRRNDIDYYGSSVVALRAGSGEVVWRFQTVHHDLWDYDVSSQPTLTTLVRDGKSVPAVIQATKMGLLFILHRETGAPLFGVEERPVPQGGAPGELLSPTQPFPVKPPPLVPHSLSPEDAWGVTPWDRGSCRKQLEALRHDGIYTPPTLQGSLMYPGNAGGSNWGSVAVDPERQILIANVSDFPFAVTLLPGESYEQARRENPGVEISPQRGTPYAMRREIVVSPLGVPCNPPPWGTLAAVDLGSGEIRWQVPLGTIRDIAPIPLPIKLGTPNIGGPLVTASGLVFIGAAMDDYLRAFDIESGEELWKGRLPAGGQATPMSYRVRPGGKQYVVIAAGGHGRGGTRLGDFIVAFALSD